MPRLLIVTRHRGLVDYLVESGVVPGAKTAAWDAGTHGQAYCSRCGHDIAHSAFGHTLPAACPLCCEVVTHASRETVEGRDVIGVLPLSLAVHAASVTEIPLLLPEHMRGKELSAADVALYAGTATRYVVRMANAEVRDPAK